MTRYHEVSRHFVRQLVPPFHLKRRCGYSVCVLPRKLTWNPKMKVWKLSFLSNGVNFRFHVSFRGSMCLFFKLGKQKDPEKRKQKKISQHFKEKMTTQFHTVSKTRDILSKYDGICYFTGKIPYVHSNIIKATLLEKLHAIVKLKMDKFSLARCFFWSANPLFSKICFSG